MIRSKEMVADAVAKAKRVLTMFCRNVSKRTELNSTEQVFLPVQTNSMLSSNLPGKTASRCDL